MFLAELLEDLPPLHRASVEILGTVGDQALGLELQVQDIIRQAEEK